MFSETKNVIQFQTRQYYHISFDIMIYIIIIIAHKNDQKNVRMKEKQNKK